MRKFALTLALVGLVALPVYAQFGFRGTGAGNVLLNKSVQEELKLTGSQKSDLKKIQDTQSASMKEAGAAFRDMDREKATEIMKKAGEATTKSLAKFKETLNTTQAKRLRQIELQSELRRTSIKVFTKEDVAKGIKLTDKQKESLAGAAKDLDADVKEIMDAAKGRGRREAAEKANKLRKKALDSFTKTMTEEQKTAWKEMTGTPFEMKFEGFPGGKGGKGGMRGKRKPKDDI